MKKSSLFSSARHLIKTKIFSRFIIPLAFTSLLISTGCDDNDDTNKNDQANFYNQVNLVSDVSGYGAAKIDTNFSNAWGIAIGSTGNFWISGNKKGVSNIYDRNGNKVAAPVAIPFDGNHYGGAPTGVVFNSSTDFVIPNNGQPAKFLFVGEDGTIDVWNTGDSTITIVDRSATAAVYKGLAIANDGGTNYLYVANFRGQKIEVFDKNFNYITSKPFSDPTIPAGYGPFNVQNINGNLYVTYAKLLAPDNEDDEKGPGNGYVNVFSPNGTLISRFASQGVLNSPWAVVLAPSGFGKYSNAILVGNFGDGIINAFTSSGAYLGQLQSSSGVPIAIDGLWGLTFPLNGIPAGDPNQLFFTAGPNDEDNGLYGYIQRN